MVTGDLTMRARQREFIRAKQVIDQFPDPAMIVLGNHDIPLTNLIRRMSAPYQKFRTHVSADLDPVMDVGTVRILGLQSMPRWRWKSGRISDRQADLVLSTFENAPDETVRVVAMHHPPSSAQMETLARRRDFERALVEARVDVVLAGHTHQPSVRALEVGGPDGRRSVLEVVAGTATSHRTRGTQRSWWQVVFNPDGVVVIEHVDDDGSWRRGELQSFALPAR